MTSSLPAFSERIFSDRRILAFLVAANLVGFFTGIYYYWDQLADSHPLLWAAILDSPVSVLLFAAVCILFYLGKKPPEAFKFLASAYVTKYGVWTMLTLWLYRSSYAVFDEQLTGMINFFLHLGMVVQGVMLVPKIKPEIKGALTVLFLCLANDVSDYLFGTVTRIPPDHLGFLMAESFAASVLIVLSVSMLRFRRARKEDQSRSRKALSAALG
jgi:uncharacterized membrane protein YpjA